MFDETSPSSSSDVGLPARPRDALDWTPPTLEEVAELFPGYEVVGFLGRGGMGAVYKARQIELDRLVAIKLLPLEVSVDPGFAERFRREARALAKLRHPNIVAVHGFDTTSAGHFFFVMEFIEGANLHEVIHQTGFNPRQALSVGAQICSALGYAHEKGIIHRDIKPANVMIDRDSHVKVADFGIARVIDLGSEHYGFTVTAVVMGSPGYMAPELRTGRAGDARADIYSLGVVIYEMLCQEVPRGSFEPPSARTGCDPRIDGIVSKAMQQASDDRYQSATAMKAAIDQVCTMALPVIPLMDVAPQPASGAVVSSPANALRNSPRFRVWLWLFGALVGCLLVAAFLKSSRWARHAPSTPPAAAASSPPLPASSPSTPLPNVRARWVDPMFAPSVEGANVYASVVQPDGRILLGGNFGVVNGQPRKNLARLRPDGTLEDAAAFRCAAGTDAEVAFILLQTDGKILLGGSFLRIDDQPRSRLARLLPDGSLEDLASFKTGTGVDKFVMGAAIQPDGKIIIAGTFSAYDSGKVPNIVRLHADGTREAEATFHPGAGGDNAILGLALQADGKIVVVGAFLNFSGTPSPRIARLQSDGTPDPASSFNPGTGPDDRVGCVAIQPDGKILIGGLFKNVDGKPRGGIARLAPNGTLEDAGTFNIGSGANGGILCISLQADGRIILSGQFTSFNGQACGGLVRLRPDGEVEARDQFPAGDGGNKTTSGSNLQKDGRIVLTGRFSTFAGEPRGMIARLLNDPAISRLVVPDSTQVFWERGGASPEIEQVTFELSTDDGATWRPLGAGIRGAVSWQLASLSLPSRGMIRARGRTTGALRNCSSGITEVIAGFQTQR